MSEAQSGEKMINVEEVEQSQVENTSINASKQVENESNPTPLDLSLSTKIDDKKIGEGVVIKNFNSESFNRLSIYDSDFSSDSEDDDDDNAKNIEQNSDSEPSSEWSQEDLEVNLTENKGAISKRKPKITQVEDEIPPVIDISTLNLNVDNEEFTIVGQVMYIVGKLVTISAIPNLPAYDVDTVLFLDEGRRPLGLIFEVLGQVTSPIYTVRFNSMTEIHNLEIKSGLNVYAAPKSKYTHYVFLQHLLKMKGSDASWIGDVEVPPEFADYSDDETESLIKHGKKMQLHQKRCHDASGLDSHKKFEDKMNKRNEFRTKFTKYLDSKKKSKVNQLGNNLPIYNPSIPPPNMRVFDGGSYMGFNVDRIRVFNSERNVNRFQDMNFLFQQQQQQLNSNNEQSNSENYFSYFANNVRNDNPGPSHQ